jgi:hypothetical protein
MIVIDRLQACSCISGVLLFTNKDPMDAGAKSVHANNFTSSWLRAHGCCGADASTSTLTMTLTGMLVASQTVNANVSIHRGYATAIMGGQSTSIYWWRRKSRLLCLQ